MDSDTSTNDESPDEDDAAVPDDEPEMPGFDQAGSISEAGHLVDSYVERRLRWEACQEDAEFNVRPTVKRLIGENVVRLRANDDAVLDDWPCGTAGLEPLEAEERLLIQNVLEFVATGSYPPEMERFIEECLELATGTEANEA